MQYVSHLFGGGFSGHVQSTVAHRSGSRSEGGGRADEEGGNSELHVVNLFESMSEMSSVVACPWNNRSKIID